MPSKVVLFYNQAQAGWSETFYHSSTDVSQIASNFYQNTWKAAIAFRAPPTRLFAIRASVVNQPRNTAIFYTGAKFVIDDPGNFTPATVSNDAYYVIQDSTIHKRPLLVRGLYDDAIERDQAGNDIPTPVTSAAVQKYVNSLRDNGFTIQSLNLPPLPGAGWANVKSIVAHGGSARLADLSFNVQPTVPFALGQTLYFRGVPHDAIPGFPRSAIILDLAAGGPPFIVTIAFDVRTFTAPFIPEKMFATQLVYQYSSIQSATFVRFSKRSTGRPIGALRGAARARIRRL